MTSASHRTGDLFVLAFDHRNSFRRLLSAANSTADLRTESLVALKSLIYEGLLLAVNSGSAASESAGILVDEGLGSTIAREARQRGLTVAVPVEASGRDEFAFEYGDDFGQHIEDLDPTYAKVLVRYNPEGDAELNRRQSQRLSRLCTWLREHRRQLMFELLVPPRPEQLDHVDGDQARYDNELRPALMCRAIEELQDSGVDAAIWKIEGLLDPGDCRRIAEIARRDGRDDVTCIVLGRGADAAMVERWLVAGAGVEGFHGFAIGRTIFEDAILGFCDGRIERDAAVAAIAQRYAHFVDVYRAAVSGKIRGGHRDL
jgi:5-dehydro-2-deoxygluconokinase